MSYKESTRDTTPIQRGPLFPVDEESQALPGPPESTGTRRSSVEELRRQLEQLRVTVQEQTQTISQQTQTISQLQAGSSGASAPSPGQAATTAERLLEVVTQSLQGGLVAAPTTGAVLATRSRTLANLLANAPKFDGSTDVLLWKKRIQEYLRRRQVTEEFIILDVLQEACEGAASDYLGACEGEIVAEDAFWDAMLLRFGKDDFSRMAEYDQLRQRPNQTYRRYADVLTEKAYGLLVPKAAQLRKFLATMLRAEELRRHLLVNLNQYEDVRALAAAAEHLVADEVKKEPASNARCRICGKTGHFAAACPKKPAGPSRAAAQLPAATRPVAAEAKPAVYYYEQDYEVAEEEAGEHEELYDYEAAEYSLDCADPLIEAGEKRPASSQHEQFVQKLRGPGRPSKQAVAGPSGLPPQAPQAPLSTRSAPL